jgi:hypothetical protein
MTTSSSLLLFSYCVPPYEQQYNQQLRGPWIAFVLDCCCSLLFLFVVCHNVLVVSIVVDIFFQNCNNLINNETMIVSRNEAALFT